MSRFPFQVLKMEIYIFMVFVCAFKGSTLYNVDSNSLLIIFRKIWQELMNPKKIYYLLLTLENYSSCGFVCHDCLPKDPLGIMCTSSLVTTDFGYDENYFEV